MNYRAPDGHEYPEYTKFARHTGIVTWVPLLVGENQVRFFALSNLQEVVSPFETGLLYTCALPPRAIVVWKPVLVLSPDMAANVNFASGVEIRIAA